IRLFGVLRFGFDAGHALHPPFGQVPGQALGAQRRAERERVAYEPGLGAAPLMRDHLLSRVGPKTVHRARLHIRRGTSMTSALTALAVTNVTGCVTATRCSRSR